MRIIVKIGSALLTDGTTGAIRQNWLDSLVDDVARMMCQEGHEVILVSSGATSLGKKKLGITQRPLSLEEKQAASACGQLDLISAYQTSFDRYDLKAAQILLTLDDSENRKRYLNATHTLSTLIKHGVIPIINENDTVTTQEMRFGDNDRLAARVAQMVGADQLILLSDIDGLYTENPANNPEAKHIPVVTTIDDAIENMAGHSSSNVGSGGMITKIVAARIATESGCETIIAKGTLNAPLSRLQQKGICTRFTAHTPPHNARKNWIVHSLQISGSITIDEGAVRAVISGKSLLPAGVDSVSGEFDRGDVVTIMNMQGKEIARGLSNYSARDTQTILGKHSNELETILGFSCRPELIHADDLVIL